MNKEDFQKELCRQLCTDIQLVKREDSMWLISNQFSYPDGDNYSIYLKEISAGQFRLSDEANTMMKLSYDTPNVDKYFKDNRGSLMEQILRENQIQEDDGNFYVDVSVDKISEGIFRLGQALSQIYDLSYLNRDRAQSTFYKTLEQLLKTIVSQYPIKLEKDYIVPDLDNAKNYVIDYSLQKESEKYPLLLFGIPSVDKAKLVNITLQHLRIHEFYMPTLLIFENQEDLPPSHMSRLMDANVGGSLVSSIEAKGPIENNIQRFAMH